ncbi:MAG TPA: heme-binding protein [Stellaceae bacterium]|nr:heme-binding protein [Stellaceae bacterium]
MAHIRTQAVAACLVLGASLAVAQSARAVTCPVLSTKLRQVLQQSVKPSGGPSNGGFDNNEWAAVVNRNGTVCAIAFSGRSVDQQWLASRAIAAEKAFTANGMSLPNYALSTANLYAQAQPGGYLFGAALSNPPNPGVLYAGSPATYGTPTDPMIGKTLGGVIVFAGGLALYQNGKVVGGIGASGDTSCADGNIVWRLRHALGFDHVPNGPSPKHNDAVIYDIGPNGKSASGFGHPTCGGKEVTIAEQIGAGYAPGQVK